MTVLIQASWSVRRDFDGSLFVEETLPLGASSTRYGPIARPEDATALIDDLREQFDRVTRRHVADMKARLDAINGRTGT